MNPANSQEALSAFQQFQAGAKNPADILAAQQQQFGVNAAQQNVQGLRGAVANTTKLLNNIAPSVMGRTSGSLVTSAQAGRQVQNESAPVATNLNQQNNALGTATQDYNTAESQASNAANLAYQGQQDQLSYLQNVYNTLYQREQDAAKAAAEQRAEQEAIRQFNESLKASRSASASSGSSAASPSFSAGGSGGGTTPAAKDPNAALKQQATQAIASLFGTGNKTVITNTINAIKKSAGYGNTYDQLKLQLIQSLHPEYLKSSGPLPGLGSVNPYSSGNAGTAASKNVLKALGL